MHIYKVSDTTRRDKAQRAYVTSWIKNPDKGSDFDKKTRWIRWLPGWILIRLMIRLKYDGLLFYEGDQFIGHIFYQRHKYDWRAFSVGVIPRFRGMGFAQKMLVEFMKHAWAESHLRGVKIGAGGHPKILHICKKVADNRLGLLFSVKAGDSPGSILFVR